MNKNYTGTLMFLLLLLIVNSLLIFVFLEKDSKVKLNSEIEEVCIDEKCFQVEIAKNDKDRALGLMFRVSLDESTGMLFIFPKSEIYSFWMKNTLVPLDIIWIDKDKTIVHVEKNVLPCEIEICPTITPEKEALYVLELNANETVEYNIEVGQSVVF